MKGNIRFVRPNDWFVPTGDTIGAITIASWLGNDIQYSIRDTEGWLNIFADVARGKRKAGYQGTGNTHSVMAIRDVVFIECEYVKTQKVLLTYSQITDALNKYVLFLCGDYKTRAAVCQPYEVEYEDEGQVALDKYRETGGTLGV
jgi:hypothetical protein